MAELWFDEEADANLTALEAGDRPHLLDQVNKALDELEADPGSARLRRHRWHVVNLWCIYVSGDGEDWMVLWEPHPDAPGDVAVQYLGPVPAKS